MYYHKYTRSWI